MKKLFYILLALLAFAGCDKEEQQLQKVNKDAPVFTTSFEDYVLDGKTKTYLDEKVKLLWHEADEISIFTSTLNQKYLFDGVTGDNSGTFTMASTGGQFGTGNEVSRNYAVYPYNAATKMNNSEEILLTLPTVQEYAQNSFGRGANTMVAVTSGLNDYFLPFKNVGGYLVLKLYAEDVTVRSIYLKGNNGEKLSGRATVTAVYGEMPVVEMAGDAAEIVEIDCGSEGVKLSRSKDEPTQFWFVVPPTFFEKGFTVCIDDINGYSMLKSSYLELTIDRNKVYSMSAIEVATESVPSNQIWYATADGEVVELGSNEGFGAAISSHVYEFGKGVITFDGPVLSIPESAFENCATLESVTIPQGVTDISSYSFRNCTNLTTVEIGEKAQVVSSNARTYNLMQTSNTRSQSSVLGAGAFFGCSRLEKVDLPKALTSIGESAFSGCASLASVKIPVGVTTISAEAFNNCSSLATIRIPENVESVGHGIFYGCTGLTDVYYMPETPPTSDVSIFDSGASNITIHVPEDSFEAYLEDPVFDGFEDEIVGDADKAPSNQIWYTSTDGSVVVPNKEGVGVFGANIVSNIYEDGKGVITFDGDVTSIGQHAFMNCTSLTSIDIPESVISIGTGSFNKCSNLLSFDIPESVTSLGLNPFMRCPNVKLTGKYVGSDGYSLVKDGVLVSFCPGTIESIEYNILSDVTSIGSYAFIDVNNLTSVTIPKGVVLIDSAAFNLCENLVSVALSEGLGSIEYFAFSGCSKLSSVTIPRTVKTIGEWAFARCSSLTSVNVPEEVTTFGPNPFAKSYNIKFTGFLAEDNGKCLVKNGKLISFSPGTDSTDPISYTIPDGVATIGADAFYGCEVLTSVIIPDDIIEICDYAFSSNPNLKDVYVYPSNPPTLGTVVFRTNVTGRTIHVPSVSESAYKNAENWSIYAKDIIGDLSIEVTQKSNEIWYTSTDGAIVEPYAKDVFGANIKSNTYKNGKGVITFDGELTSIGESAFYKCKNLKSIEMPDGITSIGEDAFWCCESIEKVIIPASVINIGEAAFLGCTKLKEFISEHSSEDGRCIIIDGVLNCFARAGLTEYVIPEGVTSIGRYAFHGCGDLKRITITESVTSFEYMAFYGCTGELVVNSSNLQKGDSSNSFTKLTFSDGVTTIKGKVFQFFQSLQSTTIPSSVSSIEEQAFVDCTGELFVNCKILTGAFNGSDFTKVTIGNSVASIGSEAFYNCDKLESVDIAASVKSIGSRAFYNCGKLESVTIPASVTSIGLYAFNNCKGLKNVYCKPVNPPTLGIYVFNSNDPDRLIHVPSASLSAYKAATNWSTYADAIIGDEQGEDNINGNESVGQEEGNGSFN